MIKVLEAVASICGVSEPVEELIYMIPLQGAVQEEKLSEEKDITLFKLNEEDSICEDINLENTVELVKYIEPVQETMEVTNSFRTTLNGTYERLGLLGQLLKAMTGYEK